MASLNYFPPLLPLLATLFVSLFAFDASIAATSREPFNCSAQIKACNALLYHIDNNLKIEDIATSYSVNSTQIKPTRHGSKQDYLIEVPCSCKNTSGHGGYFHDTSYMVKPNDTFVNISDKIYSGQAWPIQDLLVPDEDLTIHLVCGCAGSDSQIIVTYTVQENGTLSGIANLLSADPSAIVSLNKVLLQNASF